MFWGFISLCKWFCSYMHNSNDKMFYLLQDPPLHNWNIADTALNTGQLINKSHARYICFSQRHTMLIPAIHSNISRAGGYSQVLLITDSNKPTHPRQCPSPCLHPPTQKTLYPPHPHSTPGDGVSRCVHKKDHANIYYWRRLMYFRILKNKLFFRSFL